MILRHIDVEWQRRSHPTGCPAGLTLEDVNRIIRQNPTLCNPDEYCHTLLFIAAAKKVVEKQRNRIVNLL